MAIETSSDGPPAFQWLGWSLPLFRLGRISYRLNWTLMVASVFAAVDVVEAHRSDLLPFAILIPMVVVFLHAQAKAGMLRLMGGTADTSMLWSLGDSMPMRIAIRPGPQFLVAAAGILVSCLIWLSLCYCYASHYGRPWYSTFGLGSRAKLFAEPGVSIPEFCIGFASMSSCAVMLWNLVPSSIFDGGRLWRASLWPMLGLRRATWVSIIGGFVVAILLLVSGIIGTNFFTLVFGLCVLMASIYERRSMKHYGFDVVIGVEPAFTTRDRSAASPGLLGRFLKRREERHLARQEALEQQEQEVLDRLLAKVSEQGLPSLTPAERQLLGKISKQQKARSEARESRSSY